MSSAVYHAGLCLAPFMKGRKGRKPRIPQLWQLRQALQIRQPPNYPNSSHKILSTICAQRACLCSPPNARQGCSRASASHTLPVPTALRHHTSRPQDAAIAHTAAQRVRRNRAIHPAMPKASNGFVRVSCSGRLVWRVGSVERTFRGVETRCLADKGRLFRGCRRER